MALTKKVHPIDLASNKAAKAVNLFTTAKAQLDQANSILSTHRANTLNQISLLQAELKDAEAAHATNAKIAAKLAEFVS